MLALNNLVRAGKKRKRIGRGGSRGATSGRGFGGQKARTGAGTKIGLVFEGGQMPLSRRLPKRGFSRARFAQETCIVTLTDLNRHFDHGDTVTVTLLHDRGIVKGTARLLVKVLGNGALEKKLTVQVHGCSKSAREAIEKQGGEVHLTKGE